MTTVILAGGRGLRYNSDTPKPLAVIGNKSILEHLMDIYVNQDYNDFVLCLGYKKEMIIEYFDNKEHKYNIRFVDTGEDSNTANRIKLIEKYIEKENFFCTYADGLVNLDLKKLYQFHKNSDYIVTLTAVRPQNIYGVINIGFNGRVTKFNEKPRMNEYINAGFFVFRKDIFDYIDINKNEDLELDVLPRLTAKGKLGALKHDDWFDTLNSPKDEIRLNEIYNDCKKNKKELPWMQ